MSKYDIRNSIDAQKSKFFWALAYDPAKIKVLDF
jgi:hypothetical protein